MLVTDNEGGNGGAGKDYSSQFGTTYAEMDISLVVVLSGW